MSRFKMLLCRIFGHSFEYYFLHTDTNKNIRVCTRCHIAQEYKWLIDKDIWSTLMWRTHKGAKEFFAGKSDCNNI